MHPTIYKLENRLVWFAKTTYCYASNKELLNDCKNVADDYAGDGFSHNITFTVSWKQGKPEANWLNMTGILKTSAEHQPKRKDPVILRYFQYLSVLIPR